MNHCTVTYREGYSQVSAIAPANSFQRLFWDQQQKAASLSNSRSMRWHPLFIKWCLYLKHLSSKAYEMIRDSGCISLPSHYTHFVQSTSGFSAEVDSQLIRASQVSTAEDWAKCVCLVMDEMYVKEDLVYNKHSGERVGFANLGETNEQLWTRVRTHLSPRENDPKNLDVESQCMYNHFTYASCNIHLQG